MKIYFYNKKYHDRTQELENNEFKLNILKTSKFFKKPKNFIVDSMIYEKNIFQKNHKNIDLRFGLAYPNIYKTAMSSLGYNILYNLINERQDTWCERIVYPHTNSIESNNPMKNFDIISFSLQFEEDYFNVLKMIKQSGIPLKRKRQK